MPTRYPQTQDIASPHNISSWLFIRHPLGRDIEVTAERMLLRSFRIELSLYHSESLADFYKSGDGLIELRVSVCG